MRSSQIGALQGACKAQDNITTLRPTEHFTAAFLKLGPHGTHNGKAFPCQDVRVRALIEEDHGDVVSTVTITYVFANVFREAELYFPISELQGITSFSLHVNGQEAHGRLQRHPHEGKLPPRVALPPQGLPDEQYSPKVPEIVYKVWMGEELCDMEAGSKTTMTLTYGFPVPSTEKDMILWFLPFSILPRLPDGLDLRVRLPQSITSVSSPNTDNGLQVEMEGGGAVVTLQAPHVLDFRDDHLLIEVDLRPFTRPQASTIFSILLVLGFLVLGLLTMLFPNNDVVLEYMGWASGSEGGQGHA
mmetsp:Transcript_123090/g.213435  ORF Transcript_123090/g.213435 Transcript_123090/m.213435 type:complete len:302 (-) Transcript_123090:313-1218(-)